MKRIALALMLLAPLKAGGEEPAPELVARIEALEARLEALRKAAQSGERAQIDAALTASRVEFEEVIRQARAPTPAELEAADALIRAAAERAARQAGPAERALPPARSVADAVQTQEGAPGEAPSDAIAERLAAGLDVAGGSPEPATGAQEAQRPSAEPLTPPLSADEIAERLAAGLEAAARMRAASDEDRAQQLADGTLGRVAPVEEARAESTTPALPVDLAQQLADGTVLAEELEGRDAEQADFAQRLADADPAVMAAPDAAQVPLVSDPMPDDAFSKLRRPPERTLPDGPFAELNMPPPRPVQEVEADTPPDQSAPVEVQTGEAPDTPDAVASEAPVAEPVMPVNTPSPAVPAQQVAKDAAPVMDMPVVDMPGIEPPTPAAVTIATPMPAAPVAVPAPRNMPETETPEMAVAEPDAPAPLVSDADEDLPPEQLMVETGPVPVAVDVPEFLAEAVPEAVIEPVPEFLLEPAPEIAIETPAPRPVLQPDPVDPPVVQIAPEEIIPEPAPKPVTPEPVTVPETAPTLIRSQDMLARLLPSVPTELLPEVVPTTFRRGMSTGERAGFSAALSSYAAGNMERAAVEFQIFLDNYAGGALDVEAFYHLGLARMGLNQHGEAARNFLGAYALQPVGDRAAGALLRAAIALGDMGLREAACETAARVIEDFPNSTAHTLAMARRAALGCS